MMDKFPEKNELDPRLAELLDQLKYSEPRSLEGAETTRQRYLAEIEALFESAPVSAGKPSLISTTKEKLNMFKTYLGQRTALTALVAALVVLVVFASSAGMTAAAARSALPGDALYPVKTSLEQAQVNLAGDAARQVALHMKFAGLRLDEIERLIAEGRFDDVTLAAAAYDKQVQLALGVLAKVAAGDPATAASLASQITEELTRYAQALSQMQTGLPDQVRLRIQETLRKEERLGSPQVQPDGEVEFFGAIEAMDGDVWIINGQSVKVTAQTELKASFQVGDTVKVHAVTDPEGNLVAREIEPAVEGLGEDNNNENTNGVDDGNGNGNVNENDNGYDDNGNANGYDDNGNDNGYDDNGNENDNDNDNDNDNGNGNGNYNDNENENDNENDNDNGNENDNENENENENDNGNGNGLAPGASIRF